MWKKLLIHAGFITLSLLIFSLLLSPLKFFFPKMLSFRYLNRFRREVGLSVFLYACLHVLFFVMRVIEKKGEFDPLVFFRPVVFPGLLAFFVLLLLALTSNDWSIKRLGNFKWRSIHRTVYLAEAAVFIHVFLQSPFYACILILPLVFIQLLQRRESE